MNTMNHVSHLLAAVAILSEAQAQDVKRNIPYADPAHERQVLDVYSPHHAKNLPESFLDDYRNIQGRMVPMQIRAFQDGQPILDITMIEVKFLEKVASSEFEKP
jgi:hypothetical protein